MSKFVCRFLRSQRPYEPPKDAVDIINAIVKELKGVKDFQAQKFEFLTRCSNAFSKHSVPNSLLFEIKSLGKSPHFSRVTQSFIFVFLDDVYDFYMTPVDVQTPYQALVKENNLPNLHIIPEYRRYSPEEDGVSAFPRSSTLVTGLKYRNKYKGHIAKTSWP